MSADQKNVKHYHKKASGAALETVEDHADWERLKLFGSCFWYEHSGCANVFTRSLSDSPFVQRVWIALEAKKLHYQYIEVDPYQKPKELLAVNPRGLVPALKDGDWGIGESSVIMEYASDPHCQ